MANIEKLILVFEEARRLMDNPENDFAYSSWEDTETALAEIDGILSQLRSGRLPVVMDVLFAPTGPMQEVSLSSGWGDEFIDLANRYDEAIADNSQACTCLAASPRHLIVVQELGMDDRFAEVSLLRCADCDRKWLRYFYENEAFSNSGRWFLGAITQDQADSLSLYNAKSILEGLNWYFCGGSYYETQFTRVHGPINLNG
jgi:hypothetical protein